MSSHLVLQAGRYAGIALLTLIATLGIWATRSGSETDSAAGQIVATAGAFRATDVSGNSILVSPGKDSRSLLLFFCSCPLCITLARQLAASPELRLPSDILVYGIVHADSAQSARFQRATRFPGIVLADVRGEIRNLYEVGPCPNAWLVNRGSDVHFSREGAITAAELRQRLQTWPTSN